MQACVFMGNKELQWLLCLEYKLITNKWNWCSDTSLVSEGRVYSIIVVFSNNLSCASVQTWWWLVSWGSQGLGTLQTTVYTVGVGLMYATLAKSFSGALIFSTCAASWGGWYEPCKSYWENMICISSVLSSSYEKTWRVACFSPLPLDTRNDQC